MDFSFTSEQEAWRKEISGFFGSICDARLVERVEEDGSEFSEDLYRALVDKGYTGIAIPKEYGGRGMGYAELAIFGEELEKAGMPHGVSFLFDTSVHYVGLALVRLGTAEQKSSFLPRIMNGEYRFALGLTEPECGSDLAGVQCTAVSDGDDFVVNGQKIFNSAHLSTHLICLVRTEPGSARHKGLSLLFVDLRAPGVEIRQMKTLRGWSRCTVTFQDAHVPKTSLLGEINKGWHQLMSVIDLERSGLWMPARIETAFHRLLDYVKHARRDGQPLVKQPAVRSALAGLRKDITIGRLLCYRVIWLQETGKDATAYASYQKLFNTELFERFANVAMDIVGPLAYLEWHNAGERGKKYAPLKGLLNRTYKDSRVYQIAGGTSEIQRNIIASRGLGLPRE